MGVYLWLLKEWLFKLRAASETYLDESRIRFRVIAAEPLQQKMPDLVQSNVSFVEKMLAKITI